MRTVGSVKGVADFIETPYELRKHLVSHFKHIKRLDPWKRERERTDPIKKELIRDYGAKCAVCGLNIDVVAAHIIPLEIGAETTKDNLVLLCFKCHDRYDKGYISINVMKRLAQRWRRGKCIEFLWPTIESIQRLSPAMIPPPGPVQAIMEQVREYQLQKKYCKGIGIMQKALKEGYLDNEGRLYLTIKCGELTRRRAARNVVVEATEILEHITLKELPRRYHSVYYYELSYTYRLRGYHSKAAQIIRISAEAQQDKEHGKVPSLEFISASAAEILCLLAARDSLSLQEVEDFVDRLHKLEIEAMKRGNYWGGRWRLNCAAHRLQVYLKGREGKKSWETLQQVRNLYYESDIFNGWDAASKQTISLLEGLTRVFFPKDEADLDISIGLLARAFITRTGPRQRPEGIRDVGFGLVEGCRKAKGKLPERTVASIERIMKQTIDGTSVLWPWKADR
jgi:hypothetical protein